jgi:hypothetical protein
MGNFGMVLPFLRQLLTTPAGAPPSGGPDFSGMTSDNEELPPPDLSAGRPPQAPPSGAVDFNNPMPPADLSQVPPQDQGAPKLAGETKGHKLLRILQSGLQGGLMGQAQNAQTYAQTGRNAGFGGGVYGAMAMPLQLQHQSLENQQIQQLLPFLRANQIAGLQKTSAEAQKFGADARKATAETAAIPTKSALESAQAEAANYKDDPNLGLIDLRTKQPVNPSGIAPLTAAEAQVLGKNEGDRVPLKLKNTANEIAMRGISTVNTEQGVYERNRQTGSMTRLGDNPRMMFAPSQRIIQVADPDNPGETKFMTAGDAVKTGVGGTASSSVVVPKNVLKWATTGEGGKMAGAFNTAMQHADLLEKAVTALGNGDIRTLNSLKNSFSREFGSSDISNFNVISNAYSREITKMLSAGHMTDSEVGSAEATLPANASPEQLLGAIHAYKALAGSKMTILHDQFTKGMQSKPNFPQQGYQAPTGAPTATGQNGHKLVFDQGKWLDATTGQPVQ